MRTTNGYIVFKTVQQRKDCAEVTFNTNIFIKIFLLLTIKKVRFDGAHIISIYKIPCKRISLERKRKGKKKRKGKLVTVN